MSVFNGSGINGLGRKAATDIAAVGFQNIGVAQTRGTGATKTIIRFGPSKSDSARTLQAAIPGSKLVPDGSLGRTLELVVGSDYTGAQKVTITTAKPDRRHRHLDRQGAGPDRAGQPLHQLTAGLVGDRDPAQPLLTYLDGDARVELSGSTTANWVAKTANLLTDGYGGADRVGLLLPLHWQTRVPAPRWRRRRSRPSWSLPSRSSWPAAPSRSSRRTRPRRLWTPASTTCWPAPSRRSPPGWRQLPPMVLDAAVELPGHGDHFGGRPARVRRPAGRRAVPARPAASDRRSDRVLTAMAPVTHAGWVRCSGCCPAGAALILLASRRSGAGARAGVSDRVDR